MTTPLVLASASPRRRRLLTELGVMFEAVDSDIPETPLASETPQAFAQRMARDKARTVARRLPGRFVLGADTVVAIEATIFGKPAGRDDARRMLQRLSGRTHEVCTAVALVDPSGDAEELLVRTQVTFRPLPESEIEAYLDSPEPYDKAGAYGLQGGGQRFVVDVQGSRTNVVGLPIDEVAALLRRRIPALVRAPA